MADEEILTMTRKGPTRPWHEWPGATIEQAIAVLAERGETATYEAVQMTVDRRARIKPVLDTMTVIELEVPDPNLVMQRGTGKPPDTRPGQQGQGPS